MRVCGPVEFRKEPRKFKKKLGALLKTHDLYLQEFAPLMKKIVADKNAAAQENGLRALNAFLEFGPMPLCQRLAGSVLPALVGDCLKGRQRTVELATEAFLMLCELEVGSLVIEVLVKEGFTHKVKKIVPLAVDAATQALRAFGPQEVPPQLLLKAFPALFDNADAKVRDAAKSLVIEMRGWLGALMEKPVEGLRPAQTKDLMASFAELSDSKPRATRLTRSKQRNKDPQDGADGAGGSDEVVEEEDDADNGAMDTYAMMEPEEVVSKLPASWFTEVTDKNWKLRSEALDKLVALADQPRLKPGDFGPTVTVLRKLVGKDANVIVVAKAAQIVGLLATGLRQDFAPYAKALVPTILTKFKEKKATVVQQLHGSMDAISQYCIPLKDLLEMTAESLKVKIANAKAETFKWLVRAIIASRSDDLVPIVKPLATVALDLMSDSDASVRDLACHVLAVLELKLGERRLKPFMSTLDKIKATKVAEFIASEKDSVVAASASAPTKPVAVAAKANAVAKKSATPKAPSSRSASAATPAPTTPVSAHAVSAAKSPAKSPAKPKSRVWTEESAISAGEEFLTDEIKGWLAHDNFKARVKAISTLKATSDEALAANGGMTYPLMAALSQQCASFAREANFQVIQNLFDLVVRLSTLPHFSPKCINYVSAICCDKLGDFKLQKGASACLDALVLATSVDTVFHALYAPLEATKNAKAIPNALKWMSATIEEFGLAPAFSCPDLTTTLSKGMLNHKQAPIKKASVVLLGTVYKHVPRGGPEEAELTKAVESMQGVDGAVMTQINEQFALVESVKPESYTQIPRMAPGGQAATALVSEPSSVAGTNSTAAAVSVPAASNASSGPVLRNSGKSDRGRGPVFIVSQENDKAALEQLNKELMDCVSLDLLRLMTSTKQQDIVDAGQVLMKAIESDWQAVMDSLDVILKWIVLRLSDRDSVTLMAGLELMRSVVDTMLLKDDRVESYEASFFLPVLVERTGLAHDHEVAICKDALVKLTKVHPASKIFALLLDSLPTTVTNPRTRRECMDLIGTLIRRQGLAVASTISEHDLVAQVAVHLNDLEAPMRKVTSETITLLEARFGSDELLEMLHSAVLKVQVAKVLAETKHQSSPQRDAASHSLHTDHSVSVPFSSPLHGHLQELGQENEDAVVNSIKAICSDMDALAAQADGPDAAVHGIVTRLWPTRSTDGMRVRKYLVNGLLTIVSHRPCALRVDHRSVSAVVQSVLKELCEPTPATVDADRQAFLKALNIMMFRLLENCRSQLTCQVLVSLLTESINPASKADYSPTKQSDLTMKCLIKLSKSLASVDPTTVEGGMMGWEGCIRSIDHFFTTHPPAVWKTRGNDMPLKAVKTTLSHLCKALGSELLSLIDSTVPALESGPAVIRQYAALMIKAKSQSDATASASLASAAASSSSSNAASNASSGAGAGASKSVENSNPNPDSSEYMTRLHELRARYGLSVAVGTPAEVEEDAAAHGAAAQAASEIAEKKIAELRARLQAVRAPYEAGVTIKDSPSGATNQSTGAASPTAIATGSTPAVPQVSAQDQLKAIRERLAKFQAK